MNWRRQELAEYGEQVHWLEEAEAAKTQARAEQLLSKSEYALERRHLRNLESTVAHPVQKATQWLKQRIESGPLYVVFGEKQVCLVSHTFLLKHWQDMFMPSRDDVVVLPVSGKWVLYFSHEEDIEYGKET